MTVLETRLFVGVLFAAAAGLSWLFYKIAFED